MSWLVQELDPRILQGFLTLISTIIASSTALYIALYVYSKQKNLDARIRLAEQIRETCAKLAEASTAIISDPAKLRAQEGALESVTAKLAFTNYYVSLLTMQRAPQDLVERGQHLASAYGACLKKLYETFASGEDASTETEEMMRKLFESRAEFILTARNYSIRLAS